MPRDLEYEANNVAYDTMYTPPLQGIKCKNYELCKTVLPEWWHDCKDEYLCTNCDMMFGTWGDNTGKGVLDTIENVECPICLETKKGISNPNCNHTLCIDCFRRCYYGTEDEEDPNFPYSDEIYDEYSEDPNNEKWKI